LSTGPTTRSYRANDIGELRANEWPPVKRQIYEAAVSLFFEKGFDNTSVQEIVERAGMTKGALYHYFPSKDDIWVLISVRALGRLIEALESSADPSLTAVEALSKVFTELIGRSAEMRDELVVYFEQRRLLARSKLFAPIIAKREHADEMLVSLLQRGIDAGELRDLGNTRVVSFAIWGIASYALNWLRPQGPMTPEAIGLHFADMVTNGLVAKP
jgi:AcrR family transcriptional regulator